MKKILGVLLTSFLIFSATSESYKIENYKFNVKGNFWGTTNENALKNNNPVDTKTVFSEEEFNKYLENYKKDLESTRLFNSVDVEITELSEEEDIKSVSLSISLVDSNHFLVVPYPKYSSNDGFTLKLKAKDNNFLGSMNTMNSELSINIDDGQFEPGLSFSYDYPFYLGENKLTWVNDYSLSYTIGNSMPDITAKTGISFVKPYDRYSYNFSVFQYVSYNNDYKKYDDQLYFTEELNFSTPITLFNFKNYSNLNYTPYINLKYYWDFDGINNNNSGLMSPILSFGHSLSNSKVKWDGNFRRGYSLALSNNYKYNYANADFAPSLSFDAKFFTHAKIFKKINFLDELGFYTHFYGFTYIDLFGNQFPQGESINGDLRGRLDGKELGYPGRNIASTGAFINMDFPIHLFTTDFKIDIINFETQLAPFIDIGVYSKGDSIKPAFRDGIFCAGAEVLVFPKKFSSFIIRASLGVDVLKAFKDDDGIVKGVWHNKEIFIGLGAQY